MYLTIELYLSFLSREYSNKKIPRERGIFLPFFSQSLPDMHLAVTALTDADYMDIYRAMGIDSDNSKRLQKRARADEALKAVRRDVREAVRLSIDSTPTLFINGSRMVGVPPIILYRKIYFFLFTSSRTRSISGKSCFLRERTPGRWYMCSSILE